MKRINKENGGSFIVALGELVLGILLLINPLGFTKAVITVVGIVVCLSGLVNIVNYIKEGPAQGAVSQRLFTGMLEVLVGGFLCLRSDWILLTFPVLTALYGAGVLVLGVRKLAMAIDLKRMGREMWFWVMLSAGVTLICAVLILTNPFATVTALWVFIGVSLIVEAVADVASAFLPVRR